MDIKEYDRKKAKLYYEKSKNNLDFKIKRKAKAIQYSFGISIDEYEEKLSNQNYKCSICNCLLRTETTKAYLDHCHKTNKIRGFLCRTCNIGLGHFNDDIERLQSAIKYIQYHKE